MPTRSMPGFSAKSLTPCFFASTATFSVSLMIAAFEIE